jgi:hypothetical protein
MINGFLWMLARFDSHAADGTGTSDWRDPGIVFSFSISYIGATAGEGPKSHLVIYVLNVTFIEA